MNTALLHASAGSWEYVGVQIESSVNSINSFFTSIFGFLTNDEIYNSVMNKIPDGVKSAVAAGALSILGLIFIINFLGKTLNLQWVTWENVIMLLMQLLIAKVCVQNSEWIMGAVQKGFAAMIQEIPTTTTVPDPTPANPDQTKEVPITFIDMTTPRRVHITADLDWGKIGTDIDADIIIPEGYFFFLDEDDAAKAYWSSHDEVYSPDRTNLRVKYKEKVKAVPLDFRPAIATIGVFVNGLIMKAVLVVVLVIMVARFMWLAVYTVAAPLSLATFAADETRDIGKSFIKSYIGVCLHAMVLLIILVSFSAVSSTISSVAGIGGFIGLVKTFALGGMVMKSESVANKLVGAM